MKLKDSSGMKVKVSIEKFSYISFDMFDTLIYRSVSSPEEIFAIVEKKLKIKFSNECSGYAKIRQKVAKNLYRSSRKEISLNDICNALPYRNEIQDYAKNLEIETEIECVRPN